MNKNILRIIILTLVLASTYIISACASTSEAVYNNYYYQLYGNSYENLNAPYTKQETDGDINATKASMNVNKEDYRIYGKNGFDVPFMRTYNSITSSGTDYYYKESASTVDVPRYYYSYYTCSADNSSVKILFMNEKELYEADPCFEGVMYDNDWEYYRYLPREGTGIYYTKQDDSKPSIDYKSTYRLDSSVTSVSSNSFLKLNYGFRIPRPSMFAYQKVYTEYEKYGYFIFQDLYGQSTTFRLVYYWKDKNILRSATCTEKAELCKYKISAPNDTGEQVTHPLGFVYDLTVTSDDGLVYYFERSSFSSYTLKCVIDKYENYYLFSMDTFIYTVTTSEGVVYTCDNTGITKTCNGVTTQLVSYEWEKVNSEKDSSQKYDIDDEMIFAVTKNSGTSNTIPTDEKNVIKYYLRQEYRYDKMLENGKCLIYNLPYKMVMPTGLERHFEYTEIDSWPLGGPDNTVYGMLYAPSRIYEKSGDEIKNERTFSYETNQADLEYDNLYISSATETVIKDSKPIRKYYSTFDAKSRITSYEIRKGTDTYSKYTYEYIYPAYYNAKLSSETFEEFVDGKSIGTNKKTYTYTNSYVAQEKNGDYTCDYTYYEDNYYIPHTITYTRDDKTNIKTENILTEDGKSIATQNMYENDTLKSTVHYTYDSYGNVISKTIPIDTSNSAVTTYTYTYNSDGSYIVTTTQTGIIDADGKEQNDIITSVTYDSQNNAISSTDANGNITTMTYDLLNRPLTISHPDGTSESYSYDMANNITTYIGKNKAVRKAYFDSAGNISKTSDIINDKELTTQKYTYNNVGGLKEYYVYSDDNNYTKASYEYDYLDRPISEIIEKNGTTPLKTTNISYSQSAGTNSKPVYTTTVEMSGDDGTYAKYSETSDLKGNIIEKKYFTDSEQRTYTYTYDYVNNLLEETNPAGHVTTMKYDYLNRIISTYKTGMGYKYCDYNSLGLVSRESDFGCGDVYYTYDNAGRVISKELPFNWNTSCITKYYHDPNGNVILSKTPTNCKDEKETFEINTFAYDNMNRLKYSASYPTSEQTIYTQYSYDALGNPTSVVSGLTELLADGAKVPANAWYVNYEYDTLGRMVKSTTPDNLSETFEYDHKNRLVKSVDKQNKTTSYLYDDFDNISAIHCGDQTINYTHNIAGKRTSMTDSSGTTNYTYSPFSELTSETKDDIIKTYTYDNISNRTAFTVTDGGKPIINQTYEHTYDSSDKTTKVTNGNDYVSYKCNGNSDIFSISYNGKESVYIYYNRLNLPESINYTYADGSNDLTKYSYTLNGNLHMKLKEKSNETEDSGSFYYYDNTGRLLIETTWGDNISYDDVYTYDALGNRLSHTHNDYITDQSSTTNYTYNNINQLLTSTCGDNTTEYTYDAAGNMTSVLSNGETIKTYSFDDFGRLKDATVGDVTSQYTYNGDNLRQSKTVNGVITNHIYDGADVVADISDTTNVYVRGGELAFIKNLDAGTTDTYYLDRNKDVSAIVKSDGSYIDYKYNAFGENISNTSYTANPFEYCGEYTDAETDLVYLRNRYYDPSIGRFITEDPAQDGLNWYSYCENNPVNYIDPFGLDSYVFYAKGVMAGDGVHTFKDEANIWAKDLEEKYKTDVHLIEISSAKDFAEKWNKMGDNKKSIDGVVLIFHGSVDDGINGNGEKGGVGYMYVNNKNDRIIAKNDVNKNKNNVEIGDLDSKNIKKLIFSSCNSGNPDVYNVAYAFMKGNKIKDEVIAWDGGTIFNYETGILEAGGARSNQHTWKKYVKKKWFFFPTRERMGKRVLKDEY